MRTAKTAMTVVIAMGLLLAAALPAFATVYTVDAGGGGDYTTIQPALNASDPGDTILVVAGTYTGEGNRDIYFPYHNVTLEGISGAGSTIIDNQGQSGHRLLNISGSEIDTTTVVRGLTLQGGRLEGNVHGAGVIVSSDSHPVFEGCIIRDNHCLDGNGGGAQVTANSSSIFRNCTFESNTAKSYGGAISCNNGSPVTLANCSVVNNQVTGTAGSSFGGALSLFASSDALVRDSWFEGNTSALDGGAIGAYDATPYFFDTVFLDNTATRRGGVLYGYGTNAELHNCTFVKNGAGTDGSIYYIWSSSTPYFKWCIFAFSPSSRGSTFYCDGTSSPIVQECCSFANPEGAEPCGTVMNILYADPLFCDITTNDLTLAANSPCLPAVNPWGAHLGALDEGCVNSPVQETSWGTIKAMYR